MKFHDELNQNLFSGMELKPEVKDKLKEIADAFIEYLEIDKDAVEDVRLYGSSVSYNYTKYSDLDLHLVVDYDKIHEDCPIVEGYLWAFKAEFNKNHDISIYGVPVEVYAEKTGTEAISNGIYSLTEDKWLKEPEKIEPTDNDAAVEAKFNELKEAIDRCDDSEVAEELQNKIYEMRKAGLDEVGEFSTENLAFKALRNAGCLDKLKQLKKEKVDKELSLESYNESLKDDCEEAFKLLIQGGSELGVDTSFTDEFEDRFEKIKNIKSDKVKLKKAKDLLIDLTGYMIDEKFDRYCNKVDNFLNKKQESYNEALRKEITNKYATFELNPFNPYNPTGFKRQTDFVFNSVEEAKNYILKYMGFDDMGCVYQIKDEQGNVAETIKWEDVYKDRLEEAFRYAVESGYMPAVEYVLKLIHPDAPQEKIDKKLAEIELIKDRQQRIKDHMYFDGNRWCNESLKAYTNLLETMNKALEINEMEDWKQIEGSYNAIKLQQAPYSAVVSQHQDDGRFSALIYTKDNVLERKFFNKQEDAKAFCLDIINKDKENKMVEMKEDKKLYFVALDGEPVSDYYDTKEQAIQYAELNYDLDDDRVSIEYENNVAEDNIDEDCTTLCDKVDTMQAEIDAWIQSIKQEESVPVEKLEQLINEALS